MTDVGTRAMRNALSAKGRIIRTTNQHKHAFAKSRTGTALDRSKRRIQAAKKTEAVPNSREPLDIPASETRNIEEISHANRAVR